MIWAAWAICDRQSPAARFTALHIGLGLFACILQWFGHGVSGNAEFDLILALGIGTGVAFTRIEASWLARRIGPGHCRDLMIAALLIRLVAADRQETALLLLSKDLSASLPHCTPAKETHCLRLKRLQRSQAMQAALPNSFAGSPASRFAVDEFKTEEMIATGKATPAEISAALDAHRIRLFPNTLLTGAVSNTSLSAWLRNGR